MYSFNTIIILFINIIFAVLTIQNYYIWQKLFQFHPVRHIFDDELQAQSRFEKAHAYVEEG